MVTDNYLEPIESPLDPKKIKKFTKDLKNIEKQNPISTEFLYIAKNIHREGDVNWAKLVLKRAEEVATNFYDIEQIAGDYISVFEDKVKGIELLSAYKDAVLSCQDTARLASLLMRVNEVKTGEALFKKAIDSARNLDEFTSLASDAFHYFEDTHLVGNILMQAIPYANDSIDLQTISDSIMLWTKDTDLTREVLNKAHYSAKSSDDFAGLAGRMYLHLKEKTIAIELFNLAVEKADNLEDMEFVAYNIKEYLKDNKWAKTVSEKAKNISSSKNDKIPSMKLSKLQKNTEIVINAVKEKLDKIITENYENFGKEQNYKVRPGYGPDKFYLNKVEGSYEDSIQLLIHYILHEENLYEKILKKNQMKDCTQVVIDYPESIYLAENDEDLQEVIDKIYNDSIGYVGTKLVSFGYDVKDDFKGYI